MTTSQKKSNQNSFLSKSKLVLFTLAGLAAADQPVHCLKNDVIGTWKFTVSDESELPDLFNTESVCTHELPNKLQLITQGHEFVVAEPTYQLEITLNDDFTCSGSFNGHCTWTMMYDQAMIIHLPEEDLIANFRYEVKDGQQSGWDRLSTGDYDKFNWKCRKTMMGLVRNREYKDFSCAVGKQTQSSATIQVDDDRQSFSSVLAQTSSYNFHGININSFAQIGAGASYQPTQMAQTETRMRTLHDVPEEKRINFAQIINDQDLPWKANAYTQVDMEALESLDNARGPFNFAQLQSSNWPPSADVLKEAQKYLKKDPQSISTSDLPKNFDWSNFQGTDFTGPKRDQKSCGSCYMVATNTMLESRIKLWYGEERELSTQFPLQCNFLTEGCHGGWGILYSYFLESYYTVSEQDASYRARTEDLGCRKFKNLEPVASVEETYYVGGAYGKMTEESLMKEIRARGPVLYDFNAGYEFMTYNSGTLMQSNELPAGCHSQSELQDTSISTESQDDKGIQYQKLTHSTLAVGWGEDSNGKYWKVRNSYGGNWGESGYFKVRRGHNDFGGEGENSAAIPVCWNCDNVRADLR